jgi:pyruvate dehydrogenase E2 component (dihydrolipoamide acetyltransferase)
MGSVTDLVMPKLGLTMSEGRIARWALQPGRRFAAGDVVVVVETDKIANEVEAPARGLLLELLEPEGAIAPVGKPIARWRLDETRLAGGSAADAAPTAAQSSAPEPMEAAPPRPARAQAGRVVATPYARRLAREAGMPLAGLRGSGPRGRIKAADVIHAVNERQPAAAAAVVGSEQGPAPVPSAATAAPPLAPAARALSFALADVDMGRLGELARNLRTTAGDPIFTPRDYVALACMRAIASTRDRPVRPAIGVEVETPGGAALAALSVQGRVTLSSLTAELCDLGQRARQGGLRPDEQGGGVLVLQSSGPAVRVFGPAVPHGWQAALGLGTVRRLLRPDPQGRPVLAHELTLVLSYDTQALPHAAALRLLGAVKALLEEPLALLAG